MSRSLSRAKTLRATFSWCVFIGLIALVTAASVAEADAVGRVRFELDGGAAIPMGPTAFTDTWKLGYNLGGGVGLKLSPIASVVGRVSYSRFGLDDGYFTQYFGPLTAPGTSLDDADIRMTTVTLNAELGTSGAEQLIGSYITLGAGFAHMASDPVVFIDPEGLQLGAVKGLSETDPLVLGGLRFDVRASSSVRIFVLGQFAWVFAEDDNMEYVSAVAGVRVSP